MTNCSCIYTDEFLFFLIFLKMTTPNKITSIITESMTISNIPNVIIFLAFFRFYF